MYCTFVMNVYGEFLELQSAKELTKHMVFILDAKDEKVDLQDAVKAYCKHLSKFQCAVLLLLLLKSRKLGNQVYKFQLRQSVAPYHGKAFPVLQTNKTTLCREVYRLVYLGLLELQLIIKWTVHTFIIPTKNRINGFISNF